MGGQDVDGCDGQPCVCDPHYGHRVNEPDCPSCIAGVPAEIGRALEHSEFCSRHAVLLELERLRAIPAELDGHNGLGCFGLACVACREQVLKDRAEIERLRKRREDLIEAATVIRGAKDRMKEALQRIEYGYSTKLSAAEMASIARAALSV